MSVYINYKYLKICKTLNKNILISITVIGMVRYVLTTYFYHKNKYV